MEHPFLQELVFLRVSASPRELLLSGSVCSCVHRVPVLWTHAVLQHRLARLVHFCKCNADETMDSHPPRPQWDIEHG